MEYEFQICTIYVDIQENRLYLVPVFSSEDMAIIEMNTYLELNEDALDEELEEKALTVLKLCHTKEPDRDNYIPPIQQIRKSKSYKKATEKIKMLEVVWDKEEGYGLNYYRRERNGSYDLIDSIELGDTFIPGKLADAIRKGIELATFSIQ